MARVLSGDASPSVIEASPSDIPFDRVARLAATIFGAPMATVCLIEGEHVRVAGTYGWDGGPGTGGAPARFEPARFEPAARAVPPGGPYVVRDAKSDARSAGHPVVLAEPRVRFFAASPLVGACGEHLGVVSVIDRSRRRVSAQHLRQFGDLASIVAGTLEAQRAARRPAEPDSAEPDSAGPEPRRPATIQVAEPGEDDEGRRPGHCELGGSTRCRQQADLKVADSWGDSAWGCWQHAEDALRQVPSVFLAQDSSFGLRAYRARARSAPAGQGA